MRRLILLRHGQTEWNAGDRMQGQIDTDLSELGRTQAKEAAHELADRNPLAILSSDLRRARDTALIVAESTGLVVESDPRLRETHLGDWQGLTHTEVDGRYPGARAAWRRDATLAPPGGESRVDVAARSKPVVDEIVREGLDWAAGAPVIVVAHGGLIGALVAALLDLPVDRWPVLGGLANTSWVQLSGYGDDLADIAWRLDVWNAAAKVATDVL